MEPNILLERAPSAVPVGNACVPLNTSHRTGIQAMRLADDPFVGDEEKARALLFLYFGRPDGRTGRLALPDAVAENPQLGVEAEVVTARAEEFVQTRREQYDIATSRAVARLNILAELCLPYVKVGGAFLAMKGALAGEEMEEAKRAVALLGGMIEQVFEYPIQDALHKAVVICKIRPTPAKYPRAFAKIKKSPL